VGKKLTHFDETGASRMVDVSEKSSTRRMARASGLVSMKMETQKLIRDRELSKGDVLTVAQLAGIMAAKRTGELIPLCHPLPIESVTVTFEFPDEKTIRIEATASLSGKTGVEMEALTAVSVAALTIYDMCKSGGQSGHWKK
jgi:cyclic pyranopterin phosphate synthase